VTGSDEMVGLLGESMDDFAESFAGRHVGRVHVRSETWNAESERPVLQGQRVRVVAVEHLVVRVEPVDAVVGEAADASPDTA
jgi:membrane-bound ClpP family serine protease